MSREQSKHAMARVWSALGAMAIVAAAVKAAAGTDKDLDTTKLLDDASSAEVPAPAPAKPPETELAPLDDTTLGYNSQYPLPDPTLVDVAHKIWPEGEWSFVAHSGRESMKFVGTDTNVAMTVRHADGVQTQPSGKLPPLWSLDQPRRNTFANGCRNEIRDTMAIRDYRRVVELGAVNRGYDGIGQIGADLFPLKKPSGGYAATGAGRGTGWAYQGTTLSLLYPGPDGPVATERFEMLREGVQLCEAVLVLRRAVADKKLSSDLQQRTERYLASRDKTINQGDFVPWFIQTEEDAKLLGLAGEVALELGKK